MQQQKKEQQKKVDQITDQRSLKVARTIIEGSGDAGNKEIDIIGA